MRKISFVFGVTVCGILCFYFLKGELSQKNGGKGLPQKDNNFDSLLFLNHKLGFLVGSEQKWIPDDREIEGKIGDVFPVAQGAVYKTIDGGKTWQKNQLGIGELVCIAETTNILYICQDVTKNFSLETDKSIILVSKDFGESWEKISEVDVNPTRLFFVDPSKGFLVGKKIPPSEEKGEFVFESHDGGLTWNEVKEISYVTKNRISIWKENLIYLAGPITTRNELIELNTQTWLSKSYKLPLGFDGQFIATGKKGLCLLGQLNNFPTLLTLNSSFQIESKKVFEHSEAFPSNLKCAKDNILVTLGVKSGYFVEYSLYFSSNFGASWEDHIQLPKMSQSNPQSLSSDGTLWVFTGNGNLFSKHFD